MAGFASAAVAAAIGFAAGPGAGLSLGGTAGADWIGMVHLEGTGWAHMGTGYSVYPLATTKAELAWVARAGGWRFGPSLAVDMAFAGDAEQVCYGAIGGCLYPGRSGGLGAWASFRGWEVWAGVGMGSMYDTVLLLPRVRLDWTAKNGWLVGGFFSPGREVVSLHMGRAFGVGGLPRRRQP